MVNGSRLLILTFYFPPDLAAGSFRMRAFVSELQKQMEPDDTIDVIAASPNRYQSFAVESQAEETWGNVTIHRVPVPTHQSGMFDQSRAFAAFARGALRLTRGQRYSAVLATSSRLFTAFLGALVARRTKAPLYLDLRDIFTDTIEDVLQTSPLRLLLPGFRAVEKFTVRSAERVNLVSEGFRQYFEGVDGSKIYRFYPNGIDEEFLNGTFDRHSSETSGQRKIRVLYAGNIGAGQGLHRIIPDLAKACEETHEFLVVGDGGARGALEKALEDEGTTNVTLRDPIDRTRLIELYREADVLFLHLEDWDAFTKVLPSKVFEYAATGRPILAGVRGYAAKFIQDEITNAHVFEPCNVTAGIEALQSLDVAIAPRPDFVTKYRRDAIMRELVADYLDLARQGRQRQAAE